MSNTEPSELTHKSTATLIVDCGNHCDEIHIPAYQTEYDEGTTLHISKALDHPTPIAIKFDAPEIHSRIGLYSNHEVSYFLNELQESMQNILQAGIVNEKQRSALAKIVSKEFKDVKDEIYSR